MKQILLLALLALSIVSCGESGGGEYDNRTKEWGYTSSYIGYTSQASATQLSDREHIATGLVAALNYTNKIYLNATNAVMPSLFDNSSHKRTDNGTCATPGSREYNVRINTNNEAETAINFYSYCVENGVAPTINSVTLMTIADNKTILKESKLGDNSSINRTTLHTFLPQFVDVNIRRGNMNWDNNSITAGIITRDKTVNMSNDNVTREIVYVGLDMLSGSDVWRADLNIQNAPTFTKSIRFYHNKYGYVDADAVWFTNESLSNGDVITMTFMDNKTCTFMPLELGTKSFDCKGK